MCVCVQSSPPLKVTFLCRLCFGVLSCCFLLPQSPECLAWVIWTFATPLLYWLTAAEYAATDYYTTLTWGFVIITITSRTRAKKASKSIELTENFFLKEIFWCTCLEYLKYLCICQSPYYFFFLLENSWHNCSASLFFFSKKSTFTA